MAMNQKLVTAMQRAGLSQSDLAKRACISTTYMNYIVHGAKDPAVSVMKRIAEALGCKIDDLI